MKAIADATPLIHLAKIGKLYLLKGLFEKIIIEGEVYREVIEKGEGHAEIQLIKKMIGEEFIIIRESVKKIEMPSLHEGERKSISLCLDMKVSDIIIDDEEGFNVATMLELTPIRTTTLLIILLDKKLVSLEEYVDSIDKLSESGYFLDAATYARLLRIGKEIAKSR